MLNDRRGQARRHILTVFSYGKLRQEGGRTKISNFHVFLFVSGAIYTLAVSVLVPPLAFPTGTTIAFEQQLRAFYGR